MPPPHGQRRRRRRPEHPAEPPSVDTTERSGPCCCPSPSIDEEVESEMDRLAISAGLRPHTEAWKRRHNAPEPAPTPVYLNVYHLVDIRWNRRLRHIGMGVFHSGVQIYDEEWSFGAPASPSDISGVFNVVPMDAAGELHCHLFLGTTLLSREQLKCILRRVSVEWPAADYHVLHRNCNHFCEKFCKLISTHQPLTVPKWVNRASRWSDCVVPRSLATWAVVKATSTPPPPAHRPLADANVGSDVRALAQAECRTDRVAMELQIAELMRKPSSRATAAAAASEPREDGRASPTPPRPTPGSKRLKAPSVAAQSETMPPAPHNGSMAGVPSPPDDSTPPAKVPHHRGVPKPGAPAAAAAKAAKEAGKPPKPGTSFGATRPVEPPRPSPLVQPDAAAAPQQSPSKHTDPLSSAAPGVVPSPSPRRVTRGPVTFAGETVHAVEAAATPAKRGPRNIISPFDACFSPETPSPASGARPEGASPIVPTRGAPGPGPKDATARRVVMHSRGASEIDDTGDLTTRTSSPPPMTSGMTPRPTTAADDDSLSQTMDQHTVLTAPQGGGGDDEPSDRYEQTAAQVVTAAAGPASLIGASTAAAEESTFTAGITENNAFNAADADAETEPGSNEAEDFSPTEAPRDASTSRSRSAVRALDESSSALREGDIDLALEDSAVA